MTSFQATHVRSPRLGKSGDGLKMTRASFDSQRGTQGALLVGDPDEVVEKIIRHSQALGGISRITFMMNPASLPHEKLMRATKLIGTRIAPALREEFGGNDGKMVARTENSNLLSRPF